MGEGNTKHRHAEGALFESETRFRSIFENVKDVILFVDKYGKILNVNKKVDDILGYKQEEVLGKNFAKLGIIKLKDLPKIVKLFRDTIRADEKVIPLLELDLKHKNGTWVNIEVGTTVLKKDEEIIGTLNILRDITERTEEKERKKQLIHNLKFLSESSMKFVEIIPEENIHQLIADQIYGLLGNCYVLVNSYDISSNTMELKATTGIGKQLNTVLKIMGRDLIGLSFIMTDDFAKSELTKGKIVKVPGGIHMLSFGKLPKKICSAIEKVLSIREIYSMGFARGGKLYGNAVILLRNDFELKDKEIVETFMRQASVALQRKQAEEEIKKSKRKIEQQNIKLKKLAEEKTKKAKVQMENYLDIAGTMLATIDDKENITLMNKKGYEILGYGEGELIGKNWFDTLIPERIRNEIRDVYNQLMSGDIKPVEYYENSLLTKDGEERIIAFHNTVVRNPENKILGVLLSGEDITERKKTEEKIIRAKNHLQNVIDAVSEVIVAFDESNRVITWNKTAERITGYTQKQVVGKHIKKLKMFDDPQVVIDAIKNLRKGHKPLINDIIFNTKEGYKKIIKPSYSIIKSRDAETAGVLIYGEDVTYDSKHHGKILRGNSYLISDKNNKSAITLFVGLTRFNYKGLFITRSNSEMIKSMIPSAKIQVELLSQNKLGGLDNIADLKKLESKIKGFSTKHKDSLILLDRIDYLITHFSFEEFMKSLYQINNIVSSSSSILLLHLNPSIVDVRQLAIIEDELQRLPSQKIEDVQLDDELFGILKFIIQQNQLNTLVTFSQISQQFSIVRETVRKRLRTLENKELITINKQGRKKTLYVSEKGKTLLHKRKAI